MKRFHKALVSIFALTVIAVAFAFSGPVGASAKAAKETGKKCAFCHDGAPKDNKLTKEGECFKKNGNKQGSCW
jgi:cytochrome c553